MIKTGKEPIPVMTYIAILAVCLIINLPGVAITSIEGKLKDLLHTSELEIQLLTTLPNFLIIPFVLLAGKLSDYRHKIPLIVVSLIVFTGCGISYLITESMTGMIITSCFLGCANGMLIPFAMGFIVNSFEGRFKTKNLGIKSAVSNFGVVISSFVIGIIVNKANWHLPFCVYLSALLPLILCYWLKYVPGFGTISVKPSSYQQANNLEMCEKDIDSRKIWGMIFNNFTITFITFSVIIYLPQIIQSMGWDAKISAYITAVFFLSILISGFLLVFTVKNLRNMTFPFLGLCLTAGLSMIVFIHYEWAMFAGSILGGIGFGIFQPLIYDKTSYAVINPSKNIFGLSLVLTALYIGIAIEPFVITGICRLFHVLNENTFALKLGIFLAIGYTVVAFLFRTKFTFSIEEEYYL